MLKMEMQVRIKGGGGKTNPYIPGEVNDEEEDNAVAGAAQAVNGGQVPESASAPHVLPKNLEAQLEQLFGR